MPNLWLLKTEPSVYSYDDLLREGTTVWDGSLAVSGIHYERNPDRLKTGSRVTLRSNTCAR